MLNYLQHTTKIEQKVAEKVKKILQKRKYAISLFCVALLSIGLQVVLFSPIFTGNQQTPQAALEVSEIKADPYGDLPVINLDEEPYGQGLEINNPLDDLNPFNSFQKSIVDGVAEIIGQMIGLFDDYVGFTPNIANGDGNIKSARGENINIHVNKFFNATQTIAWGLLPLVIVFSGFSIALENRMKAQELITNLLKKFILFAVALISMRFFFSIVIDLCNAINRLVLSQLIGISSSDMLSESLLVALGMTIADNKINLDLSQNLNQVGEIILWVAIFFTIVTLLFQYIIRFCHVLIHMVMFPIVLVIGLLPGGGQFFKTYVEELLRMVFVQPILLIGLAFTIEILRSVDEPVPKIFLGLASLAFLNLIPSIVNRFSGVLWGIAGGIAGGAVAAATVLPAMKFKKGAVSAVTGDKSGSLTRFAGGAVGSALMNKVPGGNTAKTIGAVAGKGGAQSGSLFSKTLSQSGTKAAFGKIGMKPLPKEALETSQKSQKLFENKVDFGSISDVSLKDSEGLQSKFFAQNYDSFFGTPYTESPASVDTLADTTNFTPSNSKTAEVMPNIVSSQPTQYSFGSTFDTGNQQHVEHLNSWYASTKASSEGKSPDSYKKFAENPANQTRVLKTAKQEGYFKSQGIRTLKTTDTSGNNKYYRLSRARNRTTKTK